MYKAVVLFFLVLLGGSSHQTFAQVTNSQPVNETKTQAERLVHDGIELTGTGQFAQAVRAFEDAIRLEPDYAAAYAALGRTYFKMREWQLAVNNLRHAAALNARQREAKNAAQPQPAAANPITSVVQQEQKTATPADSASVKPEPPAPALKSEAPQLKTDSSPSTIEVSPLKTLDTASAPEEKQEPTAVSVAMNAPPELSTAETGAVSPIPLNHSSEDVLLTKIYRVGPGDVLDVRINEAQPRESTLFTITPAGLLEHPLLPEPLNVSKLTTEEIQTKLQADLKSRALIENPDVTVGVRDYASHAILVSGLVKESGTKFLRREAIPLYVVVADAQPLPEAAKATVVRNELNEVFEIDLTNVGHMNLLVRPGDVINLHPNETQFIYVSGEVKAPGEKIFRRGLTLMQAIISAGGLTSKSKVAEIARDDGRGFLVKTSFKLKDIQTGKAMDPSIQAGDRIVIQR